MQRLEHEAIAAQRHDDVGAVCARIAITLAQLGQHRLRFGRFGRDEMEFRHMAESAAGERHLTRDGGTVVTAVDDEVVALGLARDRFVDRSVKKRVVGRRRARARAYRPRHLGRGTCKACRCRSAARGCRTRRNCGTAA